MALNRYVKKLQIGDQVVKFPAQSGAMNRSTDMNYYVDGIHGSDDNIGSEEEPFKTLDRALEQWTINSGIYVYIKSGGTVANRLVYAISKHYICDVMLHLIIDADNVEIRWGCKPNNYDEPGTSGLYWYGGYLHLESNAKNVHFVQYTTYSSTHFEGATATVLADSSVGADLFLDSYDNQSWQTVKGNMELIGCTVTVPISVTQGNLSLSGTMKYFPTRSGSSLISATYGSSVTFRSSSVHRIGLGSAITMSRFCYLAQGSVCSVNGSIQNADGSAYTPSAAMPLILKLNRSLLMGSPAACHNWTFGYRGDPEAHPIEEGSIINGRYADTVDDATASPVRYYDGHIQYFSRSSNRWVDAN